jgi:transformation/transcription domain-associated protein
MLDAGKSLCSLLKMVFVAFPLEAATTPQDVKLLYQKVDELIQKHINAITAPQASNEDSTASSISFVLLVIKTLAEIQKNIVDPNILVRILQRLARDMGSSAGSHLRQVCPYFLVCFQWRGQIYNTPPPSFPFVFC